MIYGQSWRQPFGAQFSGNMSFRNPMTKAPMNNNPMGNQQTLKPMGNQSSLTPMSYSRDGVSPPKTFSDAYSDRRNNISNINDINTLPSDYELGSSDLGFLKNGIRPTVFPFPQLTNDRIGHPALIASPNELLENYREQRGGAGPDMAQVLPKNNPAAPVPQGLRQPAPALRPAPSPAIPSFDPQTPSPQGMSLNPASMQNQGIIQNPAMASQAFSLERARQYQANRQATPAAPQYINPEFRAGQANMQRLNQSMAQTLNRPLQRRADAIAGVQPGPMINRNAARNVLMGQSPDADLSMRPMTIPGMKFDPQQNAMVRSSPYEARGIQPGMLPRLKPEADAARATQYRNQWENRTGTEYVMSPDDYRVATGGYGQAMYPPGSGGQISGGNPMTEAGIRSIANARIARAARQRGVTSSGIDQWRKTSPIAQAIQSNADTRIANLPQNPAPQVQPVTVQSAPTTIPQTPAVVQQAQSNQNAGINNWPDSGTLQTNPVSPIQRTGTNEIIVPQGRPVEGRDYPAKYMMNPGFSPKVQQNWRPLPPRPPITYKQPTFGNLYRQAIGIFQ